MTQNHKVTTRAVRAVPVCTTEASTPPRRRAKAQQPVRIDWEPDVRAMLKEAVEIGLAALRKRLDPASTDWSVLTTISRVLRGVVRGDLVAV